MGQSDYFWSKTRNRSQFETTKYKMHKEYNMRVRSLRLQDFITFLGAGGEKILLLILYVEQKSSL